MRNRTIESGTARAWRRLRALVLGAFTLFAAGQLVACVPAYSYGYYGYQRYPYGYRAAYYGPRYVGPAYVHPYYRGPVGVVVAPPRGVVVAPPRGRVVVAP